MVMRSLIRWSGKTQCFIPRPNTGICQIDQGPGTVLGGLGSTVEVFNREAPKCDGQLWKPDQGGRVVCVRNIDHDEVREFVVSSDAVRFMTLVTLGGPLAPGAHPLASSCQLRKSM